MNSIDKAIANNKYTQMVQDFCSSAKRKVDFINFYLFTRNFLNP